MNKSRRARLVALVEQLEALREEEQDATESMKLPGEAQVNPTPRRDRTMAYDSRQEAASRKTLKEYAPERVTIGGHKVSLVRKTVAVPGYFVGGRLESWSAEVAAGRVDLGSMGGNASEVVAHGETRAECVAKATKALAERKPR